MRQLQISRDHFGVLTYSQPYIIRLGNRKFIQKDRFFKYEYKKLPPNVVDTFSGENLFNCTLKEVTIRPGVILPLLFIVLPARVLRHLITCF